MQKCITRVTTALLPKDKIRLQLLAKAHNVTPSAYMRAIIVDALEEESTSKDCQHEIRYFGEIPL